MKLRSLRVAAVALAAAGVFSIMQPAQAGSGSKSGTILNAGEWTGETGAANGTGGGVTSNAFWAACVADRVALSQGKAATAVSQFLSSPLNGYDAVVADLGANVLNKGAAINVKVQGPGAKIVTTVPLTKVPGGVFTQDQPIPTYDFDLSFISAPNGNKGTNTSQIPGSGCTDANPGTSTTNAACYSRTSDADEQTSCISGSTDGYGARYIIASLSLNVPVTPALAPRPGPVPYTLTWSY
jgi:hypothetical protein